MSQVERHPLTSLSTNTLHRSNSVLEKKSHNNKIERPAAERKSASFSINKSYSVSNADKLKYRLKLAYYKLRTNQIQTPISEIISERKVDAERPAVKETPSTSRHIKLLAASTPLQNGNPQSKKKVSFNEPTQTVFQLHQQFELNKISRPDVVDKPSLQSVFPANEKPKFTVNQNVNLDKPNQQLFQIHNYRSNNSSTMMINDDNNNKNKMLKIDDFQPFQVLKVNKTSSISLPKQQSFKAPIYPRSLSFPVPNAQALKSTTHHINNNNLAEQRKLSSSRSLKIDDLCNDSTNNSTVLLQDDTDATINDISTNNIIVSRDGDITPIRRKYGVGINGDGYVGGSSPSNVYMSTPGSYKAAKSLLELGFNN
jgi:hypothetical protein